MHNIDHIPRVLYSVDVRQLKESEQLSEKKERR